MLTGDRFPSGTLGCDRFRRGSGGNCVSKSPAPTADAVVESDPAPEPTVALSSVSSEPVVTAQDVEVIADLDNLLSREESRLWTEDDTARF